MKWQGILLMITLASIKLELNNFNVKYKQVKRLKSKIKIITKN
jgi:hypothetical protein